MKFFTIQTNEVIDRLIKEGSYQPDYNLATSPRPIRAAYKEILANYNVANKTKEPGLIFGFKSISGQESIEDIEELYNLLEQRQELKELFKDLEAGQHAILEVELDPKDLNLISIDFNDYIKLSLWVNYQREYNTELLKVFENEAEARKEILKIKKHLPEGRDLSERGSFIQVHYPGLELGHIKNVHPLINLDTGKLIDLVGPAKDLYEDLNLE